MNKILDIVLKVLLIGVLINALYFLGNTINNFVNWEYLEMFFIFVRNLVILFSFTYDTGVLLNLMGYLLTLYVSYWVFKVALMVYRVFR